jgi:hypothetical protein
VPFFTASLHAGAWHAPLVHTRLVQFVELVPQLAPFPQGGHAAPPQSTSVSVPSMTPFEQLCCAQACPAVQKRFTPQSLLVVQP